MPHILWHHDVHRQHQERLYFWRLGFYPTYSRDEVEVCLRTTLEEAEVKSAVCYELFGPYDLLLRVWLPLDFGDIQEFQDLLIENLSRTDLNMCDPFQVSQPARHWVFPVGDEGMPRPSSEAIAALDDSTISAIERDALEPARKAELEKKEHLFADLDGSTETTDPDDPGIKFAVVVAGDPRLTTKQHKNFLETLALILDGAETLKQRSLYAGSGFGHFLILGRVTNESFFRLGSDLLDRINEADIHQLYNARTYTHVSGQREYLLFRESLIEQIAAAPPRNQRQDRESLVSRSLSWTFKRRSRSSATSSDEDLFDNRFRLGRKLGAGGFSEVYEATDANALDDTPMAIKIIDAPGSFDRVRREVGVMRKIQHRNVVQVYWTDRTKDGRFYIASELVRGTVVQDFLDDTNKQLTDWEAVSLTLELLDALIAIHPDATRIEELKSAQMSEREFAELQELQDAGFVHRDVKPSNMIRNEAGVLKLLDFNIASNVGDPILTSSGTAPYQAPDASFDSWDVSTDLFATGVVLFQLLLGEHPYEGMQPRTDRKPRSPRAIRADLPPSIAEFLLRATDPEKAKRFASAKAMQAGLVSAWRQASLETQADRIGVGLRKLREDGGLSEQQLEESAHLGQGRVGAIESGAASPTLEELRSVARALDVSLARLLGEWG
jgi:hypothetical protein